MVLSTIIIETPFDPQYMYMAFDYVGDIFGSSSWISLIRTFMLIALISGLISAVAFRKYDFIQQFLITLVFTTILAVPVNDDLAFKRADTERIRTTSNSDTPFLLVEGFKLVNNVTKWFTEMAGASLTNPTYTGMFDAGIGSDANIIRNTLEVAFEDPEVRADLTQFIKECALYDIRDEQYSMKDIRTNSDGFDLILKNTSPARFTTINSLTGSSELQTCQDAGTYLDGKMDSEALKNIEEKSKLFFYKNDNYSGNFAEVMYQTAVQDTFQGQLQINDSLTKIMRQNMFNYMMEVSGSDMARMLKDPSMAESAAIHMGVARSAKKAAFQQSVVAQLGRQTLPAMASWFAVILIMLFPFAALMFIVGNLQTSIQAFKGYFLTLFWICLWQPIFAIIDKLGNWELERQLLQTEGIGGSGIPFGYVHTVYDTLINNHSLVGWMIMLTPIIAGAVAWSSYKGLSGMATGVMGQYRGSTSAVAGEMADGNLNMGNTNLSNHNQGNVTSNNTSSNKLNSSIGMETGQSVSYDGSGGRVTSNTQSVFEDHNRNQDVDGIYSSSQSATVNDSITANRTTSSQIGSSASSSNTLTNENGASYSSNISQSGSQSTTSSQSVSENTSMSNSANRETSNNQTSTQSESEEASSNQQAVSMNSINGGGNIGIGGSSGGGGASGLLDKATNQRGGASGGSGGAGGSGGRMNAGINAGVAATASVAQYGSTSNSNSDHSSTSASNTDSVVDSRTRSQNAEQGNSSAVTDSMTKEQSLNQYDRWNNADSMSQTDSTSVNNNDSYGASSQASSSSSASLVQNLDHPHQISQAMNQMQGAESEHVDRMLQNHGFSDVYDYEQKMAYNPTGSLGFQEDFREFYYSDRSAAYGADDGNTSSNVGQTLLGGSAESVANTNNKSTDKIVGNGVRALNESITATNEKGAGFVAPNTNLNVSQTQDRMNEARGNLGDATAGRAEDVHGVVGGNLDTRSDSTRQAESLVSEDFGNASSAIRNFGNNSPWSEVGGGNDAVGKP